MNQKHIPSDNFISSVEKLQIASIDAYMQILPQLKTGMSEKDIEDELLLLLQKKDITSFWYDIGIMVLIGEKRFFDMSRKEYHLKSPSPRVVIAEGTPVFIDFHPMDEEGIWGDFSSMVIYKPKKEDEAKVTFLDQIYNIHMDGIQNITSDMNGSDIFHFYQSKYKNMNVSLRDPRDSVGHTISSGQKKDLHGEDKRIFLDGKSTTLSSNLIWAIEPGGYKKMNDAIFVGRFEDCIFIPERGRAVILGRKTRLPFTV